MVYKKLVPPKALTDPSYPRKYIICRAFTHMWDDLGVLPMTLEGGQAVYERLLRCTCCGYEKFDYESRGTGIVLKTKRNPPIGYKLDHRYSVADCRAELQHRNLKVRFSTQKVS